jgi:hypothetical protein
VGAFMYARIAALAECLLASGTELRSAVSAFMSAHHTALPERLVALATHERALSAVGVPMGAHVSAPTDRLVATVTQERSRSAVGALMRAHIGPNAVRQSPLRPACRGRTCTI